MTAAVPSRGRPAPAPLRYDLDGGAMALLEASHDVPLVTVVVALRSGSAAEPPERAGLARIAMRMLRRGCDGLTAEQTDFRVDALGAELAVDTSPSTVALTGQVISRNVDAFVDLLARMIGSAQFPEEELARLKRESVAEIVEARDSDRVVAQKALQRSVFDGHPYGRNPGGTTGSVAAIERDDVIAFCRRHLVRGNVVIGFAGDVTPEHARSLARRLVEALPAGPAVADDVPEPAPLRGRRLVVVDKPERTQTQILVATLGTAPRDEDHVPLLVATAVFGGTFTSRLMREVRSKRGWSYGASARASIDRRRQAWAMHTFPAAEDAAPCLGLMLELLDTWVSAGVSPRETGFIRKFLVRSHAFEVDTAAKRLHQALEVELLGLPADYFTGWIPSVNAVTPEAASAAVRARVDPGALLAVVVGTASQVLEPLKKGFSRLDEAIVVPYDAE